jgi:polysaccharide biosynthesis transport protein
MKLMSDDNRAMKTQDHTEEIDVQKYWLTLKRRWPVIATVFLTVAGLSTFFALRQKPAYEIVAKILVKAERSGSLTGLNVKIGELEALGPSQQKDPLITQSETVKSIPIFKQAIASVPTPAGQKTPTPEYLLEHFKIKAISGADILQISYTSSYPTYASAIVNAVINEYIASNVSANREEAAAARRFITSQLPQTEAAVRQAELDLRRFKERDNIIVLSQEAGQAVTDIGNLQTQLDQARVAFADANARSAQFRRQMGVSPQAAVDLGALRKSTGVQEVLTKLQTAQSQLAIERTRYRDNHPTVVNLRQQVNSLNGLLNQRVGEVVTPGTKVPVGKLQPDDLKQTLIASYLQSEVDLTGLSERINQLSSLQAKQKARATSLPRLETTQRELERQLKAAQTTYETLLAKLQEVQIAENQRVGNVRLVQPASIPSKPSPSRKVLIMAAGSIAGLLLGAAMALLLDLLDQSVTSLKAVREQFDVSLLGVIPQGDRTPHRLTHGSAKVERHTPIILSRDRGEAIGQTAYQRLQTNLSFLCGDRGLKSIVVTSAIDSEGKSEVAANLAVEMAQSGRRILLVDTNMTRPALHAIWDLPNTVGLSHVLVGKSKAAEAIQEVLPHLYVLTTGGIVPDPMALLDSNRMGSLMAELADRYDFVIFDAPSLEHWSSEAVLGRSADGIVLVARPKRLTIAAATAAKAKLASFPHQVLGLIVNGVNRHHGDERDANGIDHYAMNLDPSHAVLDQVGSNRNRFRV